MIILCLITHISLTVFIQQLSEASGELALREHSLNLVGIKIFSSTESLYAYIDAGSVLSVLFCNTNILLLCTLLLN